jgi:hypothetical protein
MFKILDNIDTPSNFISSSPAKISLKENSAFSLPAGKLFSCVGETKACAGCYARKGRFLFDQVERAYAKNWLFLKALLKSKTNKKLVNELLKVVPDKAKIYRIHASGDFVNQRYVNAWAEVIKQRPHTLFWFYTRSFKFNYSKLTRLPNLTMWASTDQYNIKEARKFVRRHRKSGAKHAYGPWEHNKPPPKNSFLCPATTKKLELNGACEKCMLCVVKKRVKKNVVFLKH